MIRSRPPDENATADGERATSNEQWGGYDLATRARRSSTPRLDWRLLLVVTAFATGRSGIFQPVFIAVMGLAAIDLPIKGRVVAVTDRFIRGNPCLLAFVIWFTLSPTWATNPKAAAIDVSILLTGWGALGLVAHRITINQLLWAIAVVASVVAVVDLVAFLAGFDFVRTPNNNLKGIIGSKNHSGFLWAMGLLAIGGLVRERALGRPRAGLLAIALLPAIALANSQAAAAVLFAGVGVHLWNATSGKSMVIIRTGLVSILVFVVAASAPYLTSGQSQAASDGLAGRLPMWQALWHEVGERPILGWGPGVWRNLDAAPARSAVAAVQREFGIQEVSYAHSTYLDILLQTGAVGLALFVAGAAMVLWSVRRRPALNALVTATLAVGLVETRFPNDLSTPVLLLGAWFGAFGEPVTADEIADGDSADGTKAGDGETSHSEVDGTDMINLDIV